MTWEVAAVPTEKAQKARESVTMTPGQLTFSGAVLPNKLFTLMFI